MASETRRYADDRALALRWNFRPLGRGSRRSPIEHLFSSEAHRSQGRPVGVDRNLARYLKELERQDQVEAGTEGPSAEGLQQKIAALQERRPGYEALAQELAASGETPRSLTDPDSRPMVSGGRIEVCYNVPTAVDAKHKLIVAADVTNAATDQQQLSPMVAAAQEQLGDATPVVLADQGYYSGAEIKRCVEAGVTPLVPRPVTSANAARGGCSPKTILSTSQRTMPIAVRRARC